MTKHLTALILSVLSFSIRSQTGAPNFYEDSALCKVYELNGVNTPRTESAPVFYKSHLVYSGVPAKKPMRLFSPYKREPYSTLYSAERQDSVSFQSEKPFNPHIQSKYINGAFCFTPDDSTLYFTKSASVKDTKNSGKKSATLKQQIFYTAMNSYGLAHEEIRPFEHNSFDYDVMHPSISKDGKKLYFASNMPGGLGGYDIWVCSRGNGKWDSPVNAGPSINTPGNEQYPFIARDNTLYFASDKRAGLGGLDIFAAEPMLNGSGFLEAENIGAPLNSSSDDFSIYFIDGGKTGFISSARANNDRDIYYFRNNKPGSFYSKITFVDAFTKTAIPVTFTLTLASGTIEGKVDSANVYTARFKSGKEVNLKVASPHYVPTNFLQHVTLKDSTVVIEMRPKSRQCIEGKIVDNDLNKPIAGVKVAIYDEEGNKYLDVVTDSTGKYSVCKLPLNKSLYIGSQKKPDYFSKTEKFFVSTEEDIIKDIPVAKIVIGKAIKIDNIYFDKGKFNVRPDAALELDKVVSLMKDNPDIIIELSSHTDCNGVASANLSLSDKRAKSATAYITGKGISASRIKGKGYGESKLVNDCKCEKKVVSTCTEEQHAQNRRVEMKVTGFVAEKTLNPAKPKTKAKGKK